MSTAGSILCSNILGRGKAMKIRLAERLGGVQESATLKMAVATRALAAKGIKVTSFTVGEPIGPPPAVVCEAAHAAIREGFHRYTPVPGIPALRERIAQRFREDNDLAYQADQIAVTVGAKQALFNFFLATISPGDEVIIPAPYWTSYPEMVKIAGGRPVIVETTAEEGFKLSPNSLKRVLTSRTRVFLINSPSNPTGATYSRSEIEALAKVLESTDILVCSDEIYEKLTFEGEFVSFGAVSKDAFERTVTINGFSKSHALTGWRLGYAAGPKPIIEAMLLLQGQSTSGANSVGQKAALAGLDAPRSEMETVVQTLRERRDQLVKILSQDHKLSFLKPPATFYLFLNVEKYLGRKTPSGKAVANSDDMALYLLEEGHVGTVPGSGFGAEGYLRLSFAVSPEDLETGAKALLSALKKLQ
jgi:aspartate aminotransferase